MAKAEADEYITSGKCYTRALAFGKVKDYGAE
jgi:hypothetical protein